MFKITFKEFLMSDMFNSFEDTVLQEGKMLKQPWDSFDLKNYPKGQLEHLEKFYNSKIEPKLVNAKKEFKKKLSEVEESFNQKTLYNEKTLKSILNKIERGRDVVHMDDIIRGAILTKDRREAKKIQENIKDYFEVDEIRYREYGKDKIYGYYGQYHIRVIVDNILVEIQLMSKKLWEYKEKAHQIYSQSRLRIVQEPEYQKTPEFQELQKKSKDLFKSGNS